MNVSFSHLTTDTLILGGDLITHNVDTMVVNVLFTSCSNALGGNVWLHPLEKIIAGWGNDLFLVR